MCPLPQRKRLWGVHSPKVFPGANLLMWRKLFLMAWMILLTGSMVLAQAPEEKEKPDLLALIRDGQGEALEGILRFQPEEITVSTKDNKEKQIPSKYLKSITLEKVKEEKPWVDPKQEGRYSVKVENSQEIYTLKKKYTFSLNTNVGVVTRTIDPETINNYLSKETSAAIKSEKDKPLLQDKSVVFSLEFKF